jgi:hypothetical protein
MTLFSWLRKRTRTSTNAPRGRGPRPAATFRPRVEALERRDVPSTLTVTTTADSGPGSLRADIAAAQAGDTIVFDPGLDGQTIALATGELVLNKNLTIQGPGAPQAPVTITGLGLSRVFEVDGARTRVALSNLNLTGGVGVAGNAASAGALNGQGGAIWNGGTLTLSACNLSSNDSSAQGGAVWNGGTLTLSACTLSSNSCDGAAPVAFGGAVYNAGTLTVSNSTLSGNSVGIRSFDLNEDGDGGAIYNAGTMTVSSSTLNNNTAYQDLGTGGYGGGIFNADRASATVTGSALSGNVAYHDGAGLSNDGTLTLSGCTVSGNVTNPGRGGGIFNDQKGHLTIQSRSSIANNYPCDLYNLGSVSISKDSSVGTIVK